MTRKRALSPEDIEAMRSCRHFSRIIPKAVRGRLKRWGFIQATPSLRKYREMPYGLTPAGEAALSEYEAQS